MKNPLFSFPKTIISALVLGSLAIGCSTSPTSTNVGSTAQRATAAVHLIAIEVAGPSDLIVGQVQQYTATGVFDDGTRVDFTSGVVWSSSNVSVLTVDPFDFAGQATAVAVGQAQVRAQGDDGLNGSVLVTVR